MLFFYSLKAAGIRDLWPSSGARLLLHHSQLGFRSGRSDAPLAPANTDAAAARAHTISLQSLEDYIIEARIGDGAFAHVVKARAQQGHASQALALKLIPVNAANTLADVDRDPLVLQVRLVRDVDGPGAPGRGLWPLQSGRIGAR